MDEAAREARRQRILANSEKRLQRILGLNAPTSSDQEPGTISAILRETQIEESIHSESIFHEPPQSTTRFRGTVDSAEQSPQDNFSNKEKIPSRDSQDSDNVLLNINQATKKEPDSLKIVLVFLAITVVTMFNTGLGTLIGNNALVPFLGFEIYSMFFNKQSQSQSGGLLNTALILSGIPQKKLSLLFKIWQ